MAEPSSSDVFARAQMRLAPLFAGLIILLVLVSSLFTYLSFSSDIRGAAGVPVRRRRAGVRRAVPRRVAPATPRH